MIPFADLAVLRSTQLRRADLYRLQPVGLEPFLWTSADIPLTIAGQTYLPASFHCERGKLRLVRGLETDTLDLTLSIDARNEPLLGGVLWRAAATRGLLDGAQLDVSWVYLTDWGPPPVVAGLLPRFTGTVGDLEITRLGVRLRVKSPLALLDAKVPSKLYDATCRHSFGDGQCGVTVAELATGGTVTAPATPLRLPVTLDDPGFDGEFLWLRMEDGVCAGQRRSVASWTDGLLTLTTPLPWPPQTGDSFTLSPGCDKAAPTLEQVTLTETVPALAPHEVAVADIARDQGVAGPNGTMTAVASAPADPGQYQYDSPRGVYVFAAALAGQTVSISCLRRSGGGLTCTLLDNLQRFGGFPFIPAPETAL